MVILMKMKLVLIIIIISILLLFGFGFASSLSLSGTGNFAHNDWLELLTNYGLLGVVVFFSLFMSASRKLGSNHWDKDKKIILFSILLILGVNSLVYRFYSAEDGFLYSIMLGFMFGQRDKA